MSCGEIATSDPSRITAGPRNLRPCARAFIFGSRFVDHGVQFSADLSAAALPVISGQAPHRGHSSRRKPFDAIIGTGQAGSSLARGSQAHLSPVLMVDVIPITLIDLFETIHLFSRFFTQISERRSQHDRDGECWSRQFHLHPLHFRIAIERLRVWTIRLGICRVSNTTEVRWASAQYSRLE